MKEIDAVANDKELSHHEKATCFNKTVNVYNRTLTNQIRGVRVADKLVGAVGNVSKLLKCPGLA